MKIHCPEAGDVILQSLTEGEVSKNRLNSLYEGKVIIQANKV